MSGAQNNAFAINYRAMAESMDALDQYLSGGNEDGQAVDLDSVMPSISQAIDMKQSENDSLDKAGPELENGTERKTAESVSPASPAQCASEDGDDGEKSDMAVDDSCVSGKLAGVDNESHDGGISHSRSESVNEPASAPTSDEDIVEKNLPDSGSDKGISYGGRCRKSSESKSPGEVQGVDVVEIQDTSDEEAGSVKESGRSVESEGEINEAERDKPMELGKQSPTKENVEESDVIETDAREDDVEKEKAKEGTISVGCRDEEMETKEVNGSVQSNIEKDASTKESAKLGHAADRAAENEVKDKCYELVMVTVVDDENSEQNADSMPSRSPEPKSVLDVVSTPSGAKAVRRSSQDSGSAEEDVFAKCPTLKGVKLHGITKKYMCAECGYPMRNPDHYLYYGIECKVAACKFATTCKTRYMQHFELFHTTDVRMVPREKDLEQPFYCRCGLRALKGNKLAEHLVVCSKAVAFCKESEKPLELQITNVRHMKKPFATKPPKKEREIPGKSAPKKSDAMKTKKSKGQRAASGKVLSKQTVSSGSEFSSSGDEVDVNVIPDWKKRDEERRKQIELIQKQFAEKKAREEEERIKKASKKIEKERKKEKKKKRQDERSRDEGSSDDELPKKIKSRNKRSRSSSSSDSPAPPPPKLKKKKKKHHHHHHHHHHRHHSKHGSDDSDAARPKSKKHKWKDSAKEKERDSVRKEEKSESVKMEEKSGFVKNEEKSNSVQKEEKNELLTGEEKIDRKEEREQKSESGSVEEKSETAVRMEDESKPATGEEKDESFGMGEKSEPVKNKRKSRDSRSGSEERSSVDEARSRSGNRSDRSRSRSASRSDTKHTEAEAARGRSRSSSAGEVDETKSRSRSSSGSERSESADRMQGDISAIIRSLDSDSEKETVKQPGTALSEGTAPKADDGYSLNAAVAMSEGKLKDAGLTEISGVKVKVSVSDKKKMKGHVLVLRVKRCDGIFRKIRKKTFDWSEYNRKYGTKAKKSRLVIDSDSSSDSAGEQPERLKEAKAEEQLDPPKDAGVGKSDEAKEGGDRAVRKEKEVAEGKEQQREKDKAEKKEKSEEIRVKTERKDKETSDRENKEREKAEKREKERRDAERKLKRERDMKKEEETARKFEKALKFDKIKKALAEKKQQADKILHGIKVERNHEPEREKKKSFKIPKRKIMPSTNTDILGDLLGNMKKEVVSLSTPSKELAKETPQRSKPKAYSRPTQSVHESSANTPVRPRYEPKASETPASQSESSYADPGWDPGTPSDCDSSPEDVKDVLAKIPAPASEPEPPKEIQEEDILEVPCDVAFEEDWGHEAEYVPDRAILESWFGKKEKKANLEKRRSKFSPGDFKHAYLENYNFRTVCISPFGAKDVTNKTFRMWIGKAKEFCMRKTANGKSMAVLHYSNPDVGDTAYHEMRREFLAARVTQLPIRHAVVGFDIDGCQNHVNALKSMQGEPNAQCNPWYRYVLMENLPDLVSKPELLELFPDVVDILDYRDPGCSGVVVLEFATQQRADQCVLTNKGLYVDGQSVAVSKALTGMRQGEDIDPDEEEEKKSRYVPLSDATRINMCKAMGEFHLTRKSVLENVKLSPEEKRNEIARLVKLRQPIYEHLVWDTARRLHESQPLPEPADLVPPFAKRQLKHLELKSRLDSPLDLDDTSAEEADAKPPNTPDVVNQYIMYLLLCVPKYSFQEATPLENEKVIFCLLRVQNHIIGIGVGPDKEAAREEAANDAMRRILPESWTPEQQTRLVADRRRLMHNAICADPIEQQTLYGEHVRRRAEELEDRASSKQRGATGNGEGLDSDEGDIGVSLVDVNKFNPLGDEERIELSKSVKRVETVRAKYRMSCNGKVKYASKETRRKYLILGLELKMHLSHLTADTLRRMRDNLDIPEPKNLQHSYVKNIIDPPMPKEELKVDLKAHDRKLRALGEDREKMKNLMKTLDNYKTLNSLDQKELLATIKTLASSMEKQKAVIQKEKDEIEKYERIHGELPVQQRREIKSVFAILNTFAEKNLHSRPVYDFTSTGDETNPYSCSVAVHSKVIGVGVGVDKQLAKLSAAHEALQHMVPDWKADTTNKKPEEAATAGESKPVKQIWNVKLLKQRTYCEILEEYTQRHLQVTPEYSMEIVAHPNTPFKATVSVSDKKSGTGQGKMKTEAQNAAARTALYAIMPNLVKAKIRLDTVAGIEKEAMISPGWISIDVPELLASDSSNTAKPPDPPKPIDATKGLPTGWRAVQTSFGLKYYINDIENVAQLKLPNQKTMLPAGYEEGLDENGDSYYVNVKTGTVTKTRPLRKPAPVEIPLTSAKEETAHLSAASTSKPSADTKPPAEVEKVEAKETTAKTSRWEPVKTRDERKEREDRRRKEDEQRRVDESRERHERDRRERERDRDKRYGRERDRDKRYERERHRRYGDEKREGEKRRRDEEDYQEEGKREGERRGRERSQERGRRKESPRRNPPSNAHQYGDRNPSPACSDMSIDDPSDTMPADDDGDYAPARSPSHSQSAASKKRPLSEYHSPEQSPDASSSNMPRFLQSGSSVSPNTEKSEKERLYEEYLAEVGSKPFHTSFSNSPANSGSSSQTGQPGLYPETQNAAIMGEAEVPHSQGLLGQAPPQKHGLLGHAPAIPKQGLLGESPATKKQGLLGEAPAVPKEGLLGRSPATPGLLGEAHDVQDKAVINNNQSGISRDPEGMQEKMMSPASAGQRELSGPRSATGVNQDAKQGLVAFLSHLLPGLRKARTLGEQNEREQNATPRSQAPLLETPPQGQAPLLKSPPKGQAPLLQTPARVRGGEHTPVFQSSNQGFSFATPAKATPVKPLLVDPSSASQSINQFSQSKAIQGLGTTEPAKSEEALETAKKLTQALLQTQILKTLAETFQNKNKAAAASGSSLQYGVPSSSTAKLAETLQQSPAPLRPLLSSPASSSHSFSETGPLQRAEDRYSDRHSPTNSRYFRNQIHVGINNAMMFYHEEIETESRDQYRSRSPGKYRQEYVSDSETDPDILYRRQVQIEHCKATEAYRRYRQQIPKELRRPHEPRTPDRHERMSRDAWDRTIKKWRIDLHSYDAPDVFKAYE